MVERGLVKKVPCAEDQRGAWIVITAKGKKSAATAAPQHVTQVRELFMDVLSPSDVRALTTLTSKVLRKMDEN
jgi:DNA-binding MarR family transcriptional regulator